jgi:peroxiredoxin
MKRTVAAFGALTLLLSMSPAFAAAQNQQPVIAKTNLKVGDVAPDFTLLSDKWTPVKLSDYRGKKTVILAFYVLAFTSG